MHVFVTILGALAILVGLIGLVRPGLLITFIESWHGRTRFWFAVVFRFIIGVALVLVAPACQFPLIARVFGAIAILAAIIILVAGQKRLDETIAWWIGSTARVRSSGLFATTIGVLLIYVAGW